MSLKTLYQVNFSYTFPDKPIMNLSDFDDGLYSFDDVVLHIDEFGEVRVAKETPVNNKRKLAKTLKKFNKDGSV